MAIGPMTSEKVADLLDPIAREREYAAVFRALQTLQEISIEHPEKPRPPPGANLDDEIAF